MLETMNDSCFHGRRDVAQGVEQAVGGSQVGALSDHRHAE